MCDFRGKTENMFVTRYIVARRLNARWEYGVLRDGVIIQRREVCGDLSMPRNQDRRQNCTHTNREKKQEKKKN